MMEGLIMTKELQIIEIAECKLELSRDFISDTKKVALFETKLKESLKNIVLDLSTPEGIKEAKGLRTKANKFVKELAEFCEPLEAEGSRISKARSLLSTKLNKSKSSEIEALLAPIAEREEKMSTIKSNLFIPSSDFSSNTDKLAKLEALEDYDWLGFSGEMLPVIERQKEFLLNEKIKFEAEARVAKEAADKAIKEKEEAIRKEAADKAKAEAEAVFEEVIKEANAKVEKAEEIIKTFTPLANRTIPNNEVEHKRKINQEILLDLSEVYSGNEEDAKMLIKAIATGKIRHVSINY